MMKPGAAFLLILTLACGGNHTDPEPLDAAAENAGTETLASSVEVDVLSDTVRLVLHVTNPSDQPVQLEFSSGQRYDFAVRTAAGSDVWRWSADKSFIQSLQSQTIPAGGTVDFSEVWLPGGRTGSFVAVAELTSTNHRIQEQASFQLR